MHRAASTSATIITRPKGTVVTDPTDHGASVVLDETARSGSAALIDGSDLAASTARRFGTGDKIVITSENVLDAVLQRLDDPERIRLIDSLKNKHRCREMISALYPAF